MEEIPHHVADTTTELLEQAKASCLRMSAWELEKFRAWLRGTFPAWWPGAN
jgi:hypothetical protein